MKTVKWYKYGVFWRRGDGDDDHSAQDHDDGWIDFIYNSLTKYRRYRDTGPDAVQCLIESAELLRQGKRFPDEFISDESVKVWWMYYVRLPLRWVRKKLGLKRKPMRRSQYDMTRDPYWAFGALYAFLYRYNKSPYVRGILIAEFESLKIPLRLRRGAIVKWWRRLHKDNRKHFVKRLSFWEALGYEDWYEANYTDEFYNDTP